MGVLRKINEAVKAKDLEGLMGGEIMGNPSKWPGSGLAPLGERYATIEGTIEKTNMAKLADANAKLRPLIEPRGTWNENEEVNV